MSLDLSLTHHRGAFTLQADIATDGGVTALFGRSGAGKSTLIHLVAGLLTPDQGRIVVNGKEALDTQKQLNLPAHKRRFATVFQDARLFPHLNVLENLRFGLRYAPDTQSNEDDIVGLLGLGALLDRAPKTLSGGEKQRVALGRALICRPDLLLMDEPLASLDGPRKDEILPYLDALRHSGLAGQILYVSHDMDEIARLADTLVLLQDGKVARQGALMEVLSDPSAVPLIGTRAAGAMLEGVVEAHEEDGLTRLRLSSGLLHLTGVKAAAGTKVRVRILAKDVILSKDKPEGLSAQNILSCTVEAVHFGQGPGAAIALNSGRDRLLARITARAARQMALAPGSPCHAILKATSMAPTAISG